MKAIIVELDYKGYYKRFAMTEEEFRAVFPNSPLDDAEDGTSDTLRPLVHIWYAIDVEVGGSLWRDFFTDMAWELPESDIKNGNLAYVDFTDGWWEGELSLAKYAQYPTHLTRAGW